MSKHTIENVLQFHTTYKQTVNEHPTIPSAKDRLLRVKLIAEEFMEFAEASGFPMQVNFVESYYSENSQEGAAKVKLISYKDVSSDMDNPQLIDMVEAADGLADLDYVVQGSNVTWGFPAIEIADEVHASNMSKLDENGNVIYREDGKILKGPNYFTPNIKAIIEKHS